MTKVPKIHLAYNYQWENKETRNVNQSILWLNFSRTLEQFFEHISVGFPICTCQLESKAHDFHNHDDIEDVNKLTKTTTGYRASQYFHGSDVIFVDIDNNEGEEYRTVEQVVSSDFFQKYGTGWYTTSSHTPNHHKFRLMFRLETFVEDPELFRSIVVGAISFFNSDPACKDVARIYYGSKNCQFNVFPEKFIPLDVMKALEVEGEAWKNKTNFEEYTLKNFKPGEQYSGQGRLYLDPSVPIKHNDGHFIDITKITGKISNVFCPFHTDRKGTEFIGIHPKTKTPYLVCKKCNNGRAIWCRYENSDIKFNSWVFKKKNQEIPDEALKVDVYDPNTDKLPPFEIRDGINLIKSPKGTGKTWQLINLVERLKNQHLSVLVIGHRKSLLRSMAQKLGLSYYEDYRKSDAKKPQKYFAVTANSLQLCVDVFTTTNYDVIILDECEQVFQHVVGDTTLRNRRNVVEGFVKALKSAKSVYCLDADLSLLTVDIIEFLCGDNSVSYALNNTYKQNKRYNLWQFKKEMVDNIFECATIKDKRLYITTNSKKGVDKIASQIHEKCPKVRLLKVTSETVDTESVQDFIGDVENEIEKYDVIITSPSLSTGLDIQHHVDYVFGIFETKITTHYDIDQQLSRVRNPGVINVWIAPQQYHYQTLLPVIHEDVITSNAITNKLIGHGVEKPLLKWETQYLWLHSCVIAYRNLSINRLKDNWAYLVRDHNDNEMQPVINVIEKKPVTKENVQKMIDDSTASDGLDSYRAERQARVVAILACSTIGEELYNDYKSQKRKNAQMKILIDRFEIEQYFLQPLTEEMVSAYLYEDLKRCINAYRTFTSAVEVWMLQDKSERNKGLNIVDRQNITYRETMLYDILSTFGYQSLNESCPTIMNASLGKLVDYCKSHARDIERSLNLVVRKDIDDKPMLMVKSVLSKVGMRLVSSGREQHTINSKKVPTYFYTLDLEWLKIVKTYTLAENADGAK